MLRFESDMSGKGHRHSPVRVFRTFLGLPKGSAAGQFHPPVRVTAPPPVGTASAANPAVPGGSLDGRLTACGDVRRVRKAFQGLGPGVAPPSPSPWTESRETEVELAPGRGHGR